MSAEHISVQEAQTRLGLPPAVMVAVLRSGLLGFHDGREVSVTAVEHYQRYRTQWQDLPARRFPTDRMPVPPDVSSEQPLHTQTQIQVSTDPNGLKKSEEDFSWIVQFYVRANPFFFVGPTALSLVGPVPVRLAGLRTARLAGLLVTMCPDPGGNLAMVHVEVPDGTADDAFDRAYESAHHALRSTSFSADMPLPIAHSVVVGIPSGVISLRLAKPSKSVDFDSLPDPLASEPPELAQAKALYWEALATANPFHQFLTLWKIYERVKSVLSSWQKQHKRSPTYVVTEVMPDVWAWSELAGLSFEQVRQKLRKPYRDAVAHADAKNAKPKTAAAAKDVEGVAVQLPVVQFIARAVVLNLEATLLAEPEGEVAGDDDT